MKPTKLNYDQSMTACQTFTQKFPDFDSRASYACDSREAQIAESVNLLSYTAGTWACGEKTHYTTAQYQTALNLIQREIGDYEYIYLPDPRLAEKAAETAAETADGALRRARATWFADNPTA